MALATSKVHCAGLRVGHQALGEHLSHLPTDFITSGVCDEGVEVSPVFFLDLLHHLFAPDKVAPAASASRCFSPWRSPAPICFFQDHAAVPAVPRTNLVCMLGSTTKRRVTSTVSSNFANLISAGSEPRPSERKDAAQPQPAPL